MSLLRPVRTNLTLLRFGAATCLAGLTLGVGFAPSQARADFIVCNDSFDVLNLALARDPGTGFVSEGWWSIAPGRCAALLRGTIDSRYIYLYAIDVFNQPVLDGSITFCVEAQGFRIPGRQDCWERGHIAAGFVEIDTGLAEQWITFLNSEGMISAPQDPAAELPGAPR
jgi:uncharacterized membrane protein